ncbi:hypothetical protein [uncultured Fibrobacter sp.]|uniref:hypothetical protein n=1 Tax=uncultured Fibrobacter sp. TaxID=261512 RepID=UPI0025E226B9|nr:hypothetical protein [uncultured Fibrobacter sp.]
MYTNVHCFYLFVNTIHNIFHFPDGLSGIACSGGLPSPAFIWLKKAKFGFVARIGSPLGGI